MATGHYDSNGVWIHGEDDAYATFSDRLNKGQQSVSDALAAIAAGGKRPIARVRRNAAMPISGNTAVAFDGEMVSYPGAWTSGQPTRLTLPLPGYWDIRGTAVGQSMDANLLRAWIAFNTVEIIDSHVEINGTAGKNDGFARPSTIVTVGGTLQFVEMLVSTEVASKSLRAASSSPAGPYITLSAVWIGAL